jgi:phage terminase small subunit
MNTAGLEYPGCCPYSWLMDDHSAPALPEWLDGIAALRKRRIAAARLQEIEGNPLTAEDAAMFEMFEREGWSHERRRAHILARAVAPMA